jgi:mono/diheme cytochrome c family protein
MSKRVISLLLLGLTTLVLPALVDAANPKMPDISDMTLPMPNGLKGDFAKGATFFIHNCAACHGTKGDGNGPRAYFITPPPRNFLLAASRQRLNRPVIFEAVTNGRLGTNMPAWGKVLSNQEIANVAEFVFQNFIQPSQLGKKGSKGK